jgi:hypothetical protein
VCVTHSTTYAFGSGRGTETYQRWHLARADESSREGKVRRIQFAGQAHSVALSYLSTAKVFSLSDEYQAFADALWKKTPVPSNLAFVDKNALGIALRLACRSS